MKFQLSEVMSLKWVAGLSVSQALEVARTKQIDILANYRFHAFTRKNEAAFQDARENALIIAAIIETLEVAQVAVEVEYTPQTAAKRETKAPAKVRCGWYRSIRKFYAVAGDFGLNTSDDAAIRVALAQWFGLGELKSRSELSAGHWEGAADAIKYHGLSW